MENPENRAELPVLGSLRYCESASAVRNAARPFFVVSTSWTPFRLRLPRPHAMTFLPFEELYAYFPRPAIE